MVRHNQKASLIAILFLLVANLAAAAPDGQDTKQAPAVLDVQLRSGGELVGRAVNRQGFPIRNAELRFETRRAQLGVAQTDAQGNFRVTGLNGGEYRISYAHHTTIVRLWAPDTAPPKAKPSAFLIMGEVLRGQCGPDCAACGGAGCATSLHYGDELLGPGHFDGFFMRMLSNPWIVGTATASAIAIPLAVDDDDAS